MTRRCFWATSIAFSLNCIAPAYIAYLFFSPHTNADAEGIGLASLFIGQPLAFVLLVVAQVVFVKGWPADDPRYWFPLAFVVALLPALLCFSLPIVGIVYLPIRAVTNPWVICVAKVAALAIVAFAIGVFVSGRRSRRARIFVAVVPVVLAIAFVAFVLWQDSGSPSLSKIFPKPRRIAGASIDPHAFDGPSALALGPQGDLYIANRAPSTILRSTVSPAGFSTVTRIADTNVPYEPSALAADENGGVFVSAPDALEVRHFVRMGSLVAYAGALSGARTGLTQPLGLATDARGLLYVEQAGRVSVFAPDSTHLAAAAPMSITASGDILAYSSDTADIVMFPADASGDVEPRVVVSGTLTDNVDDFAVRDGYAYVLDYGRCVNRYPLDSGVTL